MTDPQISITEDELHAPSTEARLPSGTSRRCQGHGSRRIPRDDAGRVVMARWRKRCIRVTTWSPTA